MATSKNSKQMISGKSFEYALLMQFYEKLQSKTNVEIVKNSSYHVAGDCFNNVSDTKKSEYLLYASFTVNFLIDVEPRLANDINPTDILQLEILSDDKGKIGDVRDVIAIRVLQRWEIGVSAKNNHRAVKHSRLSLNIDFGKKWLGIANSKEYFETIKPIFENLEKIKKENNGTKIWKDLGDYHKLVYIPILNAFVSELKYLDNNHSDGIAENLVSYLVGKKDYYKVIKMNNSLEIYAYNLSGTLNLPFKKIKPKYQTNKLNLPTKILDISYKQNSSTTILVKLNNDWTLSFRLHNASTRVEPSLKFDINLVDSPKNLFKNTLTIPKSR